MKTKIETKRNQRWMSFAKLLPALVLAITTAARAETSPAAIPFSDIVTKATADYQGDALGITATADGARLRCGFQKLEGRATREGLWLESTEPGAAGKLRLVATILRREDHSALNLQLSTRLPATGAVSVTDKLVRFTRPDVTEEYSVSVDGVRQDFVILAPPAGAGDLRVELALSGARAEATADGAKLRLEGLGRELVYNRLRVTDATGRELTARLEVLSTDRLAVSVADADAVYPMRIDPTFSDADWVSLGSGMNSTVYALVVNGADLYAAGHFTNAGGVAANRIAKWDGNSWSALGSGMNGIVFALALSGTNLYAGGDFFTAGGVSADKIAKWNGSSWSALGSGLGGGVVYALALNGTNLYVGGDFNTAGGVSAKKIAKWNGSVWSVLGSGIGGFIPSVSALAASGTNLYAGGVFTNAGGVTANNIAKWDGSGWSALGSGVGPYVYALAVSGDNLYAGGGFTNAGGVTVKYIARWDGSAWSALGSGFSGSNPTYVRALAVSGTDLYVGGAFANTGGVVVNNIAKWDGSAWSALGSGTRSGSIYPTVRALTTDEMGHLVVGGNFFWAGTNVSPYIAQANLGVFLTILEQPQSQIAGIGATIELTVSVSSTLVPGYQWYFDETNAISGATNAVLQLTDVQFSDSGTYTVVVTNASLAVTSAPAILTVLAAPVIQSAPTDRTVHPGAAADFTVSAFGTLPLSYQWFFNGNMPVGGGTNPVLELVNVQYSNSGPYTVVVTNTYGAVTSPPAVLHVVSQATVLSCTEAALRDAIATGDRVTIACDGTIVLNDTVVIEANTVIDGSGHHVTISGGNAVRVLYNTNTAILTLINVTIADGQSQLGGGIYNEGTLILDGVQFQNNRADLPENSSFGTEGGAIYNQGGIVHATNCAFYDNLASALYLAAGPMPKRGGAIRNASGDVSLDHCMFGGNYAEGLSPGGCDPAFRDGEDAAGGAIHNSGTLNLRNCTLLRNLARSGYGAQACYLSGYPYDLIGGNGGEASGGAIFNDGSFEIDNSMFADNGCMAGGGGDYVGWPVGGGNGGDARGGAIWNAGYLLIRSSTFTTNTATGGRGGIGADGHYFYFGDATMGFPGGAGGSGRGGAICGGGVLVNCTFVGNEGWGADGGRGGNGGSGIAPNPGGPNAAGGQGAAGGDGGSAVGGISGSFTITNCTIASNFGMFGAGGSGGQGGAGNPPGNPGSPGSNGSATGGIAGGQILNTILASNVPGGNCSGAIDAGHNISSDGSCAFSGPGSMNNTDPMLGPLTDNGGPTLTMALLPGSPAIDAGDNTAAPPTDQRGVPRPFGSAADIGAFEFWASPPTSPTLQIGRCEGGGIDMLVCEGPIGQSCRLLTSTDLVNWTAIATNLIITTNGTLLFHETSTSEKQRFYRVTILP